MFKILFFGDVVGAIGRRALCSALPDLRRKHSPDLVIVNVENLSHGRGISAKTLAELDAAGCDGYTSGNHVWENPTGLPCFADDRGAGRLARPWNMDPALPGKGWFVAEKNGARIAVVNLMGRLLMEDGGASSPFLSFDRVEKELKGKADAIFVDFHAETTSEKEAFGHYVDGRAAAVIGTHTHVPSADQKILPGGTAYQSDAGRCGAVDSVVGFEKNSAIKRFLDPQEKAYDPTPEGQAEVDGVLITLDIDTGKAKGIDPIRVFC